MAVTVRADGHDHFSFISTIAPAWATRLARCVRSESGTMASSSPILGKMLNR